MMTIVAMAASEGRSLGIGIFFTEGQISIIV